MQRCHPDEKFIVFVCTVNEIAISLNTREYGEGKRDHVFIIVRADYATLPFRPFGKKVLVKLATCYKNRLRLFQSRTIAKPTQFINYFLSCVTYYYLQK